MWTGGFCNPDEIFIVKTMSFSAGKNSVLGTLLSLSESIVEISKETHLAWPMWQNRTEAETSLQNQEFFFLLEDIAPSFQF